ncbi:hypothetical protein HID58_067046 [Brassica napus]|uniref:Uncharacterized protein n=1 Tax=Brassica napus TaxID=3708 RepID=A0ABQ7ZHT1_BRANA|nr:hypothetical protein HID58_067046 [Brassica napus]
MCSSSMSHHLVNLVVTPSARSRQRRKIIPKPSLFLFTSCSLICRLMDLMGFLCVTNQWSPSRQWRSMEEAEKLCLWFRPVFILVVKTV